jgi:hypothetical protein
MNNLISLTTIVGILALYGCDSSSSGSSVPACNSNDVINSLGTDYHQKSRLSSQEVEFSIDRIVTEDVNVGTKSRRCAAQIKTIPTPVFAEKLERETGIHANHASNWQRSAEVIFYIKFDEHGKNYFIEYSDPDWTEQLTGSPWVVVEERL